MMETVTIEALTGLMTPIGMAVIFVWLYLQEKKSHEETRKYYWTRIDEEKLKHEATRNQYREDLREIAGMRQHLSTTQRAVEQFRVRETQEMSPAPKIPDTGPLPHD